MEITLEKIELVKDRTGVTYAEAKQALEEADGSVVDAIIAIEETVNAGVKKRGFGNKGEALFASIKEQVAKGNVSRIQVKKDDELVLNVPVNAGLVGLVIAPIASVIGVVAAFGFKCAIEIVKEDGTIIDISDAVSDTIGTVTEKGSAAFDTAKAKAEEAKAQAEEKAEEVKAKAAEKAEEVKAKAEEAKAKAAEKAEEVKAKLTKSEAADDSEWSMDKVPPLYTSKSFLNY